MQLRRAVGVLEQQGFDRAASMQLTALDSLAGSDLRQPRKIDAIIGANVLVVNGGCAGQPQQPCLFKAGGRMRSILRISRRGVK